MCLMLLGNLIASYVDAFLERQFAWWVNDNPDFPIRMLGHETCVVLFPMTEFELINVLTYFEGFKKNGNKTFGTCLTCN